MNYLDEYFLFKCKRGLDLRLTKLPYKYNRQSYFDRLAYEVSTIQKMGFSGYFLVVQDFINWAKAQNILVGDGRGSGAGSLAAFALGITNVDPIKYDLYFERFLNPARVSMPDFDIDFEKNRRDEVIQYVKQKYGVDKVAQIGTFGTFKAKKSIKDTARTLGYPLAMGTNICKVYPKPVHGKEVKLKEALVKIDQLKNWYDNPLSDEGKILHWAEKIEGRVASFGIHASGVVISNEPLTQVVPLAKGKNDEVVTQWDMVNIEEKGLIKFDFLGLKTLDLITTTIKLVKENHNVDIDITNIDMDDPDVYTNLRKGDNIGIFQLEASSGIRDLTVKVRPTCIEDLAAINAMYRPGPLSSPKMQDYLAVRAGEKKPSYDHPDLEPILRETNGWLVYQEQVLRIARDLAGYTLAEADLLRRAVGKKKKEEMLEQQKKLFSGLKANGYTEALGQILWDEIEAFSDYGFNKSHAVGYGITTYKTAWLKTKYPVEFMAAALTCDSGKLDQMIVYLQECKRMNIPVLPPDINESDLDFTPKNGVIRFGLSAIKNVGEAATSIIEERKLRGPFKNFFDFTNRVNLGTVNKKKLDCLVMSGAFDFTHETKSTLILAVDHALAYKDELNKYQSKLETFQKKNLLVAQRLLDIQNGVLSDKGKKLKPLSAPEEPEKPEKPAHIFLEELSLFDIISAEKELIGLFISGHPLNGIKTLEWNIQKLKEDEEQPNHVHLVSIISGIQLKETKDKKRMAFLTLEDLSGTIEAAVFPTVYGKNSELIVPNVPLLITAKVDYIDIENEDETVTTIPSLVVLSIDPIGSATNEYREVVIQSPLTFDSVMKLSKIVNKVGEGNTQLRLKFNTSQGLTLTSSNLIGVASEREFKAAFYT
jgi:DNA polymerase-3 subunit alpha